MVATDIVGQGDVPEGREGLKSEVDYTAAGCDDWERSLARQSFFENRGDEYISIGWHFPHRQEKRQWRSQAPTLESIPSVETVRPFCPRRENKERLVPWAEGLGGGGEGRDHGKGSGKIGRADDRQLNWHGPIREAELGEDGMPNRRREESRAGVFKEGER
jgi:hypothetical protein